MYVSVLPTAAGASADVDGIFDDEPMCMQTTVPVSSHAARNGSHQPSLSCIDGKPRNAGISENVTARQPLPALRRISAAASFGSQSCTMINGIRRPSVPAHHSSSIQSLYALTHRSPSSWSLRSVNVCPQKRGKLGNASEASTWFTSMSSSRAFWSQQPLRMSSIVIGLTVISSRGYPAAADSRVSGYWRSSTSHQSHQRPSSFSARRVVGEDAADELHVLDLAALDAGPDRLELLGQAVLPDVRRLDDVVVDRDDAGNLGSHEAGG